MDMQHSYTRSCETHIQSCIRYINGELKHREPARLPPLKHDFVNNSIGKGHTLVRHGRQFDVALRMEVTLRHYPLACR